MVKPEHWAWEQLGDEDQELAGRGGRGGGHRCGLQQGAEHEHRARKAEETPEGRGCKDRTRRAAASDPEGRLLPPGWSAAQAGRRCGEALRAAGAGIEAGSGGVGGIEGGVQCI